MAYKSRVSDAVVRRLPMYYRHLRELEKAGVVRISSQELGERMNLTASQIRQDINCFGGFGQQGYGSRGQSEGTYRRNSRLKSRISCHHHRRGQYRPRGGELYRFREGRLQCAGDV